MVSPGDTDWTPFFFRYAPRWDCGSEYEIRVQLLNEKSNPMETFAPRTIYFEQWNDQKWHQVSAGLTREVQRPKATLCPVFSRSPTCSRTTARERDTSALPTEERTRSSGRAGMESVSQTAVLRFVQRGTRRSLGSHLSSGGH